jgi:broad specificity phosphatase PhoE
MPAKNKTTTTNEQQSSSKTLFLIRHGQSIANRDYDESIAYRDAGLTEQGIAQAKALHKELQELELDLVVVSPLTRALQTCQYALPPSYSGPILVLPEIAEICSSYYSCGQKRSVIQPKFPSSFDWSNVSMDEIWWWQYDQKHHMETNEYQKKRIEKFRHFIQERPEKRIAVFSHGDYLYEFLEGKRSYLANCQVTTYKI